MPLNQQIWKILVKKFDTSFLFYCRTNLAGNANLYSGHVVRGSHSALIFISTDLFEAFNNASQLHLDATFKIVPAHAVGMKQVLTVSALAFNHVSKINHV